MFDSYSIGSGGERRRAASPAPSPVVPGADQEQHPCPPRRARPRRGVVRGLLAALILPVTAAACDDNPFGPLQWFANPEEATIYSLTVPELNLPTAFDFIDRSAVRIESARAVGRWDVALDTRDGSLVLLPPEALDVTSRARITVLADTTFDEVEVAPADTTLYSAEEPVPVALGNVYVVRTREVSGSFGRPCVFYAKLEPLSIDVDLGRLVFLFDASPVCNDRRLVPPE